MTQTLHQRTAIRAYNNVVALRPQRMPDAWRHTDQPAPLAVVPPPQPTATEALNERLWQIHDTGMRWLWQLAIVAIVVADIAIIAALVTGGAK